MSDADARQMSSSRPYLIRAIYEWILDNGMTPYLLVSADIDNVEVPRQYVQEGRIVLNVADRAVQGLDLGNEAITFNARFSGTPMDVYLPVHAVLAIYAQENGQGMMFPEDETPPPTEPGPPAGGGEGDKSGGKGGRPNLKVVK